MAADLLAQWHRLSSAGFNNRAVAAQLHVSEAQLVASACGTSSERLVADAFAILEAARRLGTVKWVVRNDFAVIERRGRIERIDSEPGRVVRVDAGSVRLELAAGKVASAFALTEPRGHGAKRSLQLFDASGVSAVKLVAVSAGEFGTLVNTLRHARQSRQEPVELAPLQASGAREGMRPGALDAFLHRAAALGTPLDIRVRNPAATLGVVSPIRRVKRSERAPWINVLDPDLEIHLHEARIRAFNLDQGACGAGALNWHADSGEPAMWMGCTRDFESLARAARAEDRPGSHHPDFGFKPYLRTVNLKS